MAPPAAAALASTTLVAPSAGHGDENTKADPVEWVLWKARCPTQSGDSGWKASLREQTHYFVTSDAETTEVPSSLPMPSKMFFTKTTVDASGTHAPVTKATPHSELSLFRRPVQPMWEDSQNIGELYANHYFPPALLDEYWKRLVGGLMNEKINNRHVTGIRVVDKSHHKHPCYRLELWLNTKNTDIIGAVKKQALLCVEPQDAKYRFQFHWRQFEKDASAKEEEKDGVKNDAGGDPMSED